MNDIYIARTIESPEVDFRFSSNVLTLFSHDVGRSG